MDIGVLQAAQNLGEDLGLDHCFGQLDAVLGDLRQGSAHVAVGVVLNGARE